MDYISTIRQPIEADLATFGQLFGQSLTTQNTLLNEVLDHIKQRGGKRMRPMLIFLMAKNIGGAVTQVAQQGAVGLELLHTASLVHDDVVDESDERRGQRSVNAAYSNQVAVLVGDFMLSTALLQVNRTHSFAIVEALSELGRTLANGEILQLQNIDREEISEEVYYQVIHQKTAAFFETCVQIGALSVGASDEQIVQATRFGKHLGMIFQIRDDIFDYYDAAEIGKPTGNDMAEGKLTLPVIYALRSTNDATMMDLAHKVKRREATAQEIAQLVQFTKDNGGIAYAEQRMWQLHAEAMHYIDTCVSAPDIKAAFTAYLDYVIQRKV